MVQVSLLNTNSPSQTPQILTVQQLPRGYRFCPDDQELLRFFLYPKLTNPLFTTSAPVRDCDLYGHTPLQIWNTFHGLQGQDLFFFTNLKKKTPDFNVTRKIAGGPATWHREDNNRQICVPIDRNFSAIAIKKCFSYRNSQSDQPGCSWIMYEYSLPSLSEVIVLCQLRRKDDDNSHQTQTTKKRKRDADGVDNTEKTISQKARVDQDDKQQQGMGAAETVSKVVYNGVKFDNEKSFYHEVVQDFDNDQMTVNSITSAGNIAAPTASTLNGSENLQTIDFVCMDNDGEPAATEEADDFYKEILGMLDFSGCSDKSDGEPDVTEEADDFYKEILGLLDFSGCSDKTDGEPAATEEADDFYKEILGLMDFSGCSDKVNGEPAATEEADDFCKDILGLLGFSGCSDKAEEVTTIQAKPGADRFQSIQAIPEADGVQATPIGSNLAESLAIDAVDYHLDSEVSYSSLSSNWRESFAQKLLQANPTSLIQENEVQMISNPFYME